METNWEFIADATEAICKGAVRGVIGSIIIMGLAIVPTAWLFIGGGETAFRSAMILLIAGFIGWAIFSLTALILIKVHEWAFDKFVDSWPSRQGVEGNC